MSKTVKSRRRKRLERDDLSNEKARSRMLPSPNPTTNLLIADVVLRGFSLLARRNVEKRVAKASMVDKDEAEAERLVKGKSIVTTIGLYGASRLATRSPAGLGLVATGLAAKTLYDRGKARQRRRAKIAAQRSDKA